MLLPVVVSSSNEMTLLPNICHLIALSYNLIKFGGLGESKKKKTLLPFMPLCIHQYTQQLMDDCALLPSGSE